MRAFFEFHQIEVLLLYGLSFIVLGAVLFVLPKQHERLPFVRHLPLLAAFGLIHGTLEFVILWKVLHQIESLVLEGLIASLLFLSFLPLLEFGRRTLWNDGSTQFKERSGLFTPWLYAALLLAIISTMHLASDTLAGLVAGTRYFLGFPAALLAGLALCNQAKNNQALLLNGTLQGLLYSASAGFLFYALFTIVLPSHDPALPALFLSQQQFLDFSGIPVQAARALCALIVTVALVRVVRSVNHDSRRREIEQIHQTEYANDLLNSEIEQRAKIEEELQLLALTFETQEAVIITDAHARILRVNAAFQTITGYSLDEVRGQNPRILSSGQHDIRFYSAMWAELQAQGKWSGEIWNRRKNGEIYPEWLTITPVRNKAGEICNYVGTFTDIGMRKHAEEEIRQLALYDHLTKLPNRRLLQDRLLLAFNASNRNNNFGAVMFIDLDNFKNINDTKGHDTGDLLLIEVASRLLHCVRESDTVARIGGDEFVLLLTNLGQETNDAITQIEKIAEKILATLRQPYLLIDYEYYCSASMGVSLFKDHQTSVDELFRRADTAMYRAKASGKNTWYFFDPAMQATLEARLAMESALHNAITHNEFRLYFQAQYDTERRITGAETLLRWQHPQRGLVGPGEFITLAEENGLILPIGQWVLEQACAQLKAWESNPRTHLLKLAVNVSAVQFRQTDFVEIVERALKQSGAEATRLELELTESLVLDDIEGCIAKMRELKLLGISFSMDDFGTGYSSLSSLKRLPIDQLKIDQSFVRDIASDPDDEAIVRTIIAMAKNLRMEVIAEGVETEGQFAFLKRNGCTAFQGYLLGRPVPVADFERQLPDASEPAAIC
ncbi:MAG: EAL domain-containing protein [Gallionella sp.]|nr:EAL domain-containing protein [Gallionella sp.]